MRTLTPAQAATRLGITDHAVRNMIHAGRLGNLTAAGTHPAAIPYSDVSRVMLERRREALRRVKDEVDFAHQCRKLIWPNKKLQPRADGNVRADDLLATMRIAEGVDALPHLPADAVALWGNDVLAASARKFPAGTCKTCFARAASSVHESLNPRDDEPTRILLGPPCTSCRETFAAETRNARRELQRLQHDERAFRDRQTVAAFRAEQRKAMADVKEASQRFAALDRQRKAMGLPPEGRKR